MRRVVLASTGAPLPAARAGQHVVLRVTTAGRSIERPYTLSGAAGGPWEVTVKREPGGAFSGWLFEEARPGSRLEASNPMGTHVWEVGPAPMVCFVGGVGVTPALAFARTLLREGWPNRLVIDWSTRSERDLALLGELRATVPSNLTLQTRVTSQVGRLQPDAVAAWARRFPTATFTLCGTEGFMRDVATSLAGAGVPAERVRVESFDRDAR